MSISLLLWSQSIILNFIPADASRDALRMSMEGRMTNENWQ